MHYSNSDFLKNGVLEGNGTPPQGFFFIYVIESYVILPEKANGTILILIKLNFGGLWAPC